MVLSLRDLSDAVAVFLLQEISRNSLLNLCMRPQISSFGLRVPLRHFLVSAFRSYFLQNVRPCDFSNETLHWCTGIRLKLLETIEFVASGNSLQNLIMLLPDFDVRSGDVSLSIHTFSIVTVLSPKPETLCFLECSGVLVWS